MSMTRSRIFRCLILGTALAVAALAVACDDPGTEPAPSPVPTPTTAASPAHTPTGVPVAVEPSRAQTPTSSNSGPMPTATSPRGATPFPTAIEPAPTTTAPPSPERTLQERIEGLFSDYRDNAPFDDHLKKLSDYQSPTPAALSSFETLAAHAREDFELTKRAVIAAGFLGLDSSEANLTIDAYLKHQQKYGLQDPTGFASVTDLILFQNQLNTPGLIRLPDGSEEDRRSYALSSEERTETLIAGADIWSWLALPAIDLRAIPDWVTPIEGIALHLAAARQHAGQSPFSLNASQDIRFSAAPIFNDNDTLVQSNRAIRTGDLESYNAFEQIRRQHLDMLELQPNATAHDLEALATGNLDGTKIYLSLDQQYAETAITKLDFLITHKSDMISGLDVRSRAFIDDIGTLANEAIQSTYSKTNLLRSIEFTDNGAFLALGIQDPALDKTVFPRPANKDIVLYIAGAEYRMNVFEAFSDFDPERIGIMSVSPHAKDTQGEYGGVYWYSVIEGGTILTIGEPRMGVILPLRYPFVDSSKTKSLWEFENLPSIPGGTYGVAFLFNPAAFDEGFNKDPLYANDPAAQNRGPWIKVFDNRENAPR